MPTNAARRPLAAVLLALAPAAALGIGYSAPNVTPADLGMAASRVAAQDGAAAVFANPSALARLEGLHLSLAASAIDLGSTWTDPTGTQSSSASTRTDYAVPPALYASYGFTLPNDMRAAFGAGVAVPFGGNVFWPASWPGRFDVVNVDRRIYAAYLTAAVEPLPWLRLGSGAVWYHGTEHLALGLDFGASEGTAQLSTVGDGVAFDLSAEIDATERLRFGVDYKHQAVMVLDGHAHFDGAPPQLGLVDQAVRHEATMPNTLGVGLSYRLLPALLLTGAFTWERYVVFAQDRFVGSSGLTVAIPRKYHDGHTYAVGLEAGPLRNLKLRLGGGRGIAPARAEWLHPSLPDSNVWLASGGVAYVVRPALEVSASYEHAFFDRARTCQVTAGQCTPGDVFPAIQDAHASVLGLGVTWRWAAEQ